MVALLTKCKFLGFGLAFWQHDQIASQVEYIYIYIKKIKKEIEIDQRVENEEMHVMNGYDCNDSISDSSILYIYIYIV